MRPPPERGELHLDGGELGVGKRLEVREGNRARPRRGSKREEDDRERSERGDRPHGEPDQSPGLAAPTASRGISAGVGAAPLSAS